MRLYDYRQSSTSPLKYHLELRPEELELVKDLVKEIYDRIKYVAEQYSQEEDKEID